jgi:putative DNA primase/helicase
VSGLAEAGIRLRREQPGEHRTACPQCGRQKQRPRDDALAVKIEAEGSLTWFCHRCGWRGALPAPGVPYKRVARAAGPSSPPKPEEPPASFSGPAERNQERAQAIWRESTTVPDGGIARAYLVERRRIMSWDQDRLRWHPKCPWELGTAGCLIAPVNAAVGGLVVGVWRIRPVLTGEVQRRGLGPAKGNCSRIIQADGPLLAVTEGVEDALAYHELSGIPTWAALNAGNLVELVLPARFTEVQVVADADDVGMQRAREAVLRFRRESRRASLIRPVEAKDANDVLRARRAVG